MTKVYDGKMSTVTLSALRQSIALFLGIKVKFPQRSTLNEQLKWLADRTPAPTDRPTIKYLAIGNRGHGVVVDADGFTDIDPYGKTANVSGLCNLMPFVLRAPDNDLSDAERERYRARIPGVYGGKNLIGYFLRTVDMSSVETVDTLTIRENGVETIDSFTYQDSDLNPVPAKLPEYNYDDDSNVSQPDGRYVSSSAVVTFGFDEFDVAEYQNVCAILRGDASRSVISELALCSGVDAIYTGESSTGSSFSYMEAIGVTAAYHIGLFKNLSQENQGFTVNVRVGMPEPMFIGAV